MTVPAQGFVRCRQADGVATVELVNAKSMNILGSEAIEELTAEFRRLSREDGCRVVVLRGAGNKAFIGGADTTRWPGWTGLPARPSSGGPPAAKTPSQRVDRHDPPKGDRGQHYAVRAGLPHWGAAALHDTVHGAAGRPQKIAVPEDRIVLWPFAGLASGLAGPLVMPPATGRRKSRGKCYIHRYLAGGWAKANSPALAARRNRMRLSGTTVIVTGRASRVRPDRCR
jgi:Enoyl-CoA hydratase/isomerase